MKNYKTIGIIGGQGPVSTSDFYMRIVKYFQQNLGAKYVRDFPPMIIFSTPTPDLVEKVENEELTFSLIAHSIKKLEADGADFIVIACNSLQYLIDRFNKLVSIPIYAIAPIIGDYAKSKGFSKVGILATRTTISNEIFVKDFNKYHIKLVPPNDRDQRIVEEVILNKIAGKTSKKDLTKLKKVIANLEKEKVDGIMLACTELPLVISQSEVAIPVLDCTEIYAQKTALYSVGKE